MATTAKSTVVDNLTARVGPLPMTAIAIGLSVMLVVMERGEVRWRGFLHPVFQLGLVLTLSFVGWYLVSKRHFVAYVAVALAKFPVIFLAPKIDPYENGLGIAVLAVLFIGMEVAVIKALRSLWQSRADRPRWLLVLWIVPAFTILFSAIVALGYIYAIPRQAYVTGTDPGNNARLETWFIDYGGAYGADRGGIHSDVRGKFSHPYWVLETTDVVK